jgi:hypothetical protein
MKLYYLFALTLLSILACKDDDDPQPSNYPINYVFDRIDQNDEGLYLVVDNNTLADLPTDIGLFGAFKDSLKTELQETVVANLVLEGVEILDEDDIKLHYELQGFPIVTPVKYETVNGDIILTDTNQLGLISYDHVRDEFALCGATPFSMPGPNAVNPAGLPYFNFNVNQCVEGQANRGYAEAYLISEPLLRPEDTIGVLITRYLFVRE